MANTILVLGTTALSDLTYYSMRMSLSHMGCTNIPTDDMQLYLMALEMSESWTYQEFMDYHEISSLDEFFSLYV